MSKNAIVTGANGFLGKYLTNLLIENDYFVYAISRNKLILSKDNDESLLKSLISDMDDYKSININAKIIDVVYLVAWRGTRGSDREDASIQELNFEHNIELIDKLVRSGSMITKIILIGSQAEYGDEDKIEESVITSTDVNAYGKTKSKLYYYLRDKYTNILVINARVFSIYGYGDSSKTLISCLLSNIVHNKKTKINNAATSWNFTFVKDIVNGLLLLSESENAQGVYNLTSTKVRTIKQYVDEIVMITQCSSELIEYRKSEIKTIQINNDRICQLGWKELYEFDEEVMKIFEYIKRSHNE